jgi:NTE family protein
LAPGALGVRPGEGVVLPMGLVQGQKITQALRAATLRVGAVDDFDRLPTPFRALATDLESGEPVVLRSGDLATVLRASMSAPGVLAPVEIGGRLLVDGGLVDNLPVRLAREMDVDVLIVVDVSFPLAQRGDLQSPLDVTNQMIAIMVRRGTTNSRALLRAQDVLIEPDLGSMTSLDFDRVPMVMASGETTTLAARRRLESLSLDEGDWQRYLAARTPAPQPPQTPAFVRAGERSQEDAARITAVFGDLAQKPLDPHELQRRANREYGLDRYEAVDYRLVRAGDAEGVELDLRRKSWGPNYLRLGLGVESDYDGGSRANAAAQLLMTDLNAYDADLLLQAQIGEEPGFFAEYFQPLSLRSDFFFAPSLRHEFMTRQVIDDSHQVARYRSAKRAPHSPSARNSRTGARYVWVCGAVTAARTCWSATRRCRWTISISAARISSSATTGSTALTFRSADRPSGHAGSRIVSRSVPASTPTSSRPRGNSPAAQTVTASCCRSTAARHSTTA